MKRSVPEVLGFKDELCELRAGDPDEVHSEQDQQTQPEPLGAHHTTNQT